MSYSFPFAQTFSLLSLVSIASVVVIGWVRVFLEDRQAKQSLSSGRILMFNSIKKEREFEALIAWTVALLILVIWCLIGRYASLEQ